MEIEVKQGDYFPYVEVPGPHGVIKVTFVGREGERREPRRYYANSKAYPAGVREGNAELKALAEALPAPKQRGEDPENDRAYDAYNRAYIKAGRVELKAVLDALVAAGWLSVAPKAAFSRYAGCSCPCSPGFKLDQTLYYEGKPVDLSLS